MVRESIITLALLHEFVNEFIRNNTYIIQDRTALEYHLTYLPCLDNLVSERPLLIMPDSLLNEKVKALIGDETDKESFVKLL